MTVQPGGRSKRKFFHLSQERLQINCGVKHRNFPCRDIDEPHGSDAGSPVTRTDAAIYQKVAVFEVVLNAFVEVFEGVAHCSATQQSRETLLILGDGEQFPKARTSST
ncbi:hypothetical protein CH292_25225 [Rhodococcus sp. 14-2470-1a]|nr:hypothetical protein CH292_25225 [Rhodococcus sp. 14-2470-1a]